MRVELDFEADEGDVIAGTEALIRQLKRLEEQYEDTARAADKLAAAEVAAAAAPGPSSVNRRWQPGGVGGGGRWVTSSYEATPAMRVGGYGPDMAQLARERSELERAMRELRTTVTMLANGASRFSAMRGLPAGSPFTADVGSRNASGAWVMGAGPTNDWVQAQMLRAVAGQPLALPPGRAGGSLPFVDGRYVMPAATGPSSPAFGAPGLGRVIPMGPIPTPDRSWPYTPGDVRRPSMKQFGFDYDDLNGLRKTFDRSAGISAAERYLASHAFADDAGGSGDGSGGGGWTRRTASGGGGDDGRGRRRGGFWSYGDSDLGLQAGDFFRGILPGGKRESTGAIGVLGATAAGLGAVAAPGLGGLALAGAGFGMATIANIAALGLAFDGLGKAIGGSEKDFKKLTATEKEFALEIRGFIPWVDQLQRKLQSGILPGVSAGLNSLLSPDMVRNLESGAKAIGDQLGSSASQLGSFLGSPEMSDRLGRFLQNSTGWTQDFTDSLISLFDALTNVVDAGAPFIDWVSDGIAKGSAFASTWVDAKIATGDFNDFLGEAQDSLRTVGDALGSVVGFLGSLGSVMKGPVENALEVFGDLLDRISGYLDKNRDQIDKFLNEGIEALDGALRAIGPVITGVFEAIEKLVGALGGVADAMGGWESAFQLILGGLLAKKVLEITTALVGATGALAGGAASGGAMGGLAGALRALTASPWTIAIGLAIAAGTSDVLKDWATDKGLRGSGNFKVKASGDYLQVEDPSGDIKMYPKKGVESGEIKLPADVADAVRRSGFKATTSGVEETPTVAETNKANAKRRSDALAYGGTRFNPIEGNVDTSLGAPGGGTHSRTEGSGPGGYQWQDDDAVDIVANEATKVLAVVDGTLSGARFTEGGGRFGGWGVTLTGDDGNVYFYKHMRQLYRRQGRVAAGTVIGAGTVNGHIHFAKKGAASTSAVLSGAMTGAATTASPAGGATNVPWGSPDTSGGGAAAQPDVIRDAEQQRLDAADDSLRSPGYQDDIRVRQQIVARLKRTYAGVKGSKPDFARQVQGAIRQLDDEMVNILKQNILTDAEQTKISDADTTPGYKDDVKARQTVIARLKGLDFDNSTLDAVVSKTIATLTKQVRTIVKANAPKMASETSLLSLVLGLERADKQVTEATPKLDKLVDDLLAQVKKGVKAKGKGKDALSVEDVIEIRSKMKDYTSEARDVVAARKAAYKKAFGELAEDAQQAFDDATKAYVSPFRKQYEQNAAAKDDLDLKRQLEQAEKALEQAKLGTEKSNAEDIVRDSRNLLGRYTLANEIDKVQSAILGGQHVDQFGEAFADNLRDILNRQMTSREVDEEAVKAAEQRVVDIKFEIQQKGLLEKATADEKAWADQRKRESEELDASLKRWQAYYAKLVAIGKLTPKEASAAAVARAKDDAVMPNWLGMTNLNRNFIGPGGGWSEVGATTPSGPTKPLDAYQDPLGLYWDQFGGKSARGIGFFAEGGIADRPTLGVFGERGREALIPLDDPRSRRMLGGGSTNVEVHLASGMEWLEQFIEVKVVDAADAVGGVVGSQADRYRREGRV